MTDCPYCEKALKQVVEHGEYYAYCPRCNYRHHMTDAEIIEQIEKENARIAEWIGWHDA